MPPPGRSKVTAQRRASQRRPVAQRPAQEIRSTPRYRRELRELGQRLRALRQERGWTLEEASEQVGIDWRHIGRVELGELNVTIATLVRLAVGYGVKVGEFFW
jgi:ribosome-binding protein aMBF1 (putative translation factor)